MSSLNKTSKTLQTKIMHLLAVKYTVLYASILQKFKLFVTTVVTFEMCKTCYLIPLSTPNKQIYKSCSNSINHYEFLFYRHINKWDT